MNGTDYFFRVANSVFENNTAISGGALYTQLCSQAIYYNNRLVNNTATGSGGHIFQVSTNELPGTVFMSHQLPWQDAYTCKHWLPVRKVSDLHACTKDTTSLNGKLNTCRRTCQNIARKAIIASLGKSVLALQLNCGGAMVLNAISKGSAQAGGGAYINAVGSLALYQNEWTGNTAKTGAGAVNFQSVQDSLIANNTFIKYGSCSCVFNEISTVCLQLAGILSRL